MSIDGHIEAWEIGIQLEKSTWYKKPQDRNFEIKTLDIFVKSNVSSVGAMIHFSLSVSKYDELVRQYETILVDYINTTMAKAKALGSIVPTQTESDSLAAKNMFAKDPTSKIRSLDSEQLKLTARAKALHTWLTKTLDKFLLYNSKHLLAPNIKALITKRIRIANTKKTQDSWKSLSSWMRKQLRDMSPQYMLDSIMSMAWLSFMPVIFWTNTFIMLRDQLKLKGQSLLDSIAYDY